MDLKVNLCYCNITVDADIVLTATQLRSYIGYKFIEDTEFHHHDDKPFRYPLIQYKRIKEKLYVLGILQYTDLVFDRMSGLQHIVLAKKKIPITNIKFKKSTHVITDEITEYSFCSPWIALNAENYVKYKKLDKQFKKRFLEDILVGNLLSMLKGLDMRIDYRLYAHLKWYKELPIVAHKHGFSGFYAKFVTNLSLPKYIGIGKSVSKGFGIIQPADSQNLKVVNAQTE